MSAVNRVHWIRARAQKNRWQEELTLTGYEMQWTVRHFQHQAGKWRKWRNQAEDSDKQGAAAYAARKDVMWTKMAQHADRKFTAVSAIYQTMASPADKFAPGSL
jgi:hypothetical protein